MATQIYSISFAHFSEKGLKQYRFSSLDRVEGLEDHGAKTVLGLATRTIAKVAAYTFRKYLLRFHGIDVLTLQAVNIL